MTKISMEKLKIKTPEEAFKSFGKWFDDKKRITLIVTIIVGLLTHVLLLSLLITSPDGLWNGIIYSANATEVRSGRWMINIIDSLRKNMAIPSITTIVSIVITSITAIFINDLFKFKSKISCIVTAVFLIVSPCFTMTLLYVYTSDAYCFAFLFATLAVWCMHRENKWVRVIFGSIFTALTLGLYQGYIGAIIGLCILRAIVEVFEKIDYKKVFINIGICILSFAIGIGLYYGIEQFALNIYGVDLSDYGGVNEISLLNILQNLPQSLLKTYLYFIKFFVGGSIVNNANMSRNVFYMILFGVEGLAMLNILYRRKADSKKEKIIDTLLLILFSALLPIGFNFVVLIAPDTICYPLNTAQILLIIPYMMLILENFEVDKGAVFKWVSLVLCCIIAFTYFLAAHSTYTGIRMKYNQAYSKAIRMVDRIENAPGYDPYKPWLIAGIIDETNTPMTSEIYFLTLGGIANGPIFHGNYIGMNATWDQFFRTYVGIIPNFCSQEQYDRICASNEFKKMSIFPAKDSVKEIDGVMVLKLTDNVPKN